MTTEFDHFDFAFEIAEQWAKQPAHLLKATFAETVNRMEAELENVPGFSGFADPMTILLDNTNDRQLSELKSWDVLAIMHDQVMGEIDIDETREWFYDESRRYDSAIKAINDALSMPIDPKDPDPMRTIFEAHQRAFAGQREDV